MKRTLTAVMWMLLAATLAHGLAAAPNADDKVAAQFLPGTTQVYVEIPSPKATLGAILDHPYRKSVEASEPYKKWLDSPQYADLQKKLDEFEKATGMTARQAAELGSIHVGFDLKTLGVAVLIKADDAAKLSGAINELATRLKIPRGNTYRGIDTWKVDKGGFAVHGKWLVASNSADLGKFMFDRMLDGGADTLATDREFLAARKSTGSEPDSVWAFGRLALLRLGGHLKALDKEKSDNPGVELLGAGIIETLRQAPNVAASLRVKQDDLRLTVAAPHDASKVDPRRAFFFAPAGKGAAPALKPAGLLASITTYRDFPEMFKRADDLFDENVAAGLAQADSQLTLFFSGTNFFAEIMPRFGPQVQMVATRPTFKDVTPGIKLPAFASVFTLKDADENLMAQLRTAFNSILAFINLQGGQEGRPMLVSDIDKRDGATILSSKYLVDAKKVDKTKAELIYNFSPTIVLTKQHVIISSTKELGEQLLDELLKQKGTVPPIKENTLIEIDGGVALEMLRDNRQQLIAQSMIGKGLTPEQALAEVETLLDLAKLVKSAKGSLTYQNNAAVLDLNLKLNVK